ncbi:flagellar basal body P-ring formation chaperone FlgA [Asticcacaulis machinosus]|uniref:Flagellar basal body P-ring formation chaperone FlgA n=1 Tax=Asticcacaulis machinosus TaxID=2984211 RepID=A0ABT5HNZ4_9CAUL|nr:flagellar basal body P-ring formation chaperone FlgA [Asticcacaulis machinosus]MDC7677334.1 flagellar basal body P-ring formation chaperone FlgA [Asticcacaulis machinosus]
MRKLLLYLAFAAAPTLAMADNMLVLKAAPSDSDGRITLGDVFDYADGASDVVLGVRSGATAVLDAAQVQAIARQNGYYWTNPKGLRRIIVAQGADSSAPAPQVVRSAAKAPAGKMAEALTFTRSLNTGDVVQPSDIAYQPVQAHLAGANVSPQDIIGKSARYPLREGAVVRAGDLSNPVVVKKSQSVKVVWTVGGINLSMTGLAQKDGAAGDVIQVLNPTSKKTVDAVITGPGTAAAGPAALQMRASNPQYYSAR